MKIELLVVNYSCYPAISILHSLSGCIEKKSRREIVSYKHSFYHPQLASILNVMMIFIMNTQVLNRLEIGMNYWQLANRP